MQNWCKCFFPLVMLSAPRCLLTGRPIKVNALALSALTIQPVPRQPLELWMDSKLEWSVLRYCFFILSLVLNSEYLKEEINFLNDFYLITYFILFIQVQLKRPKDANRPYWIEVIISSFYFIFWKILYLTGINLKCDVKDKESIFVPILNSYCALR